jgi:hypothetical protein
MLERQRDGPERHAQQALDRLPECLAPKGRSMDLKLEVVPVPVSDVDAAKAFYT